MNDLVLIRPSKKMEKDIWEYRQEYLLCGEKHINGCCGIGYYDDFDTWLEFVLAIEKDKLSREGVHASTFFSVRKSDNKIIGSIQLRHFLTEDLKRHGGQMCIRDSSPYMQYFHTNHIMGKPHSIRAELFLQFFCNYCFPTTGIAP